MIRPLVHLALHVLVPAAAARLVWPSRWVAATVLMLATMLVDLDHLLADPILDPNRCSIGFHPLHTVPAVGVYVALLGWRPTRIIAAGLLIHMALDGIDCWWMG